MTRGKLDITEKGHKLKAQEIRELTEKTDLRDNGESTDTLQPRASKIFINLPEDLCTSLTFSKMRDAFSSSKGECPVYIKIFQDNMEITMATSFNVDCDHDFQREIEFITGEGSLQIS